MTLPTIAAQLYTVREHTQTAAGLAASLKKVAAIGYRAVQISSIGPIPDAEVKAMLDDNGLTCCITHDPEPWPWQDLDAVIARHKLWGCPHAALGGMPMDYRASEAGYWRLVKEANAIGKRLHEAGLTLSYHNHSFEFVRFGQRLGMDLIYQETDPRYLKAELDTFWVQFGGGDPAAWITKMAGRMPVVHFKDMCILFDPNDEASLWRGKQTMAEIGEGNLNWPAILAACEAAGVEWCAVEQDVCQRDPFESLKISYENLNAMGLR